MNDAAKKITARAAREAAKRDRRNLGPDWSDRFPSAAFGDWLRTGSGLGDWAENADLYFEAVYQNEWDQLDAQRIAR